MNKIKKYLLYFSLEESEKRILSAYKEEFAITRNLSSEELNSLSIEYKTRYERKKSIFSLFLITVALAALTAICSSFYAFLKYMLPLITSNSTHDINIAKTMIIIFIIVLGTIVIAIFGIVNAYLQSLQFLHKKILIIDEIIKENKGEKE